MSEFRHDERERDLARKAYKMLEPYHLPVYFAPEMAAKVKEMDLSWGGGYFGMRAAPMGACTSSVVATTFYNFNPETVAAGWDDAMAKYSPGQLSDARYEVLDKVFSDALGELKDNSGLPKLAARLQEMLKSAPTAGRTLAGAWMQQPWPQTPHLALWQALSILREWRGDGHIAALVLAGLSPVEANVFHAADHPDGAGHGGMSKKQLQGSRNWNEAAWKGAAAGLADRGLVSADGEREVLTERGADLDRWIEDHTDDAAASIWVGTDDADDIFAAAKPFVKAIIDAGILPGTKKN
ncbi:MAG: hypothetical protein ABI137_07735 [Antricoccus sp.]